MKQSNSTRHWSQLSTEEQIRFWQGIDAGETASFLVPAASWLQKHNGSWHGVFVIAAIANIAVGATALLIVKPMRISRLQRTANLASHAAAK